MHNKSRLAASNAKCFAFYKRKYFALQLSEDFINAFYNNAYFKIHLKNVVLGGWTWIQV